MKKWTGGSFIGLGVIGFILALSGPFDTTGLIICLVVSGALAAIGFVMEFYENKDKK